MKNRVYLSPLSLKDLDEFIIKAKASKDSLFPWIQAPSNSEAFKAYFKKMDNVANAAFLIKDKQTNEIIGVININEIVRGSFQSGYLGFYCFEPYTGTGLMSEGLKLVITYAFESLKLHRLEANVQPNNQTSIDFISRNGFQKEGYSPNYLKINGIWEDHERFALTAEVQEQSR